MKNSNVLTSAMVVIFLQITSMVNAQDGGVNLSLGQVFQDESYTYVEGEVGIKNSTTTFYVHYGQGKMIFQQRDAYDFILATTRDRDNKVVAMGVRPFLGKNKKKHKGLNLDFQASVMIDKERVADIGKTFKRTNFRSSFGIGYRFKIARIFLDLSAMGGHVNLIKPNAEGFSALKTIQLDPGLNAKIGFSF